MYEELTMTVKRVIDMERKDDSDINKQNKVSAGERQYIAIDLKSFYASVECVERDLDPLTTNLVVADRTRTDKTICLAVSPSLKAYGISGRARLYQAVAKIDELNTIRKRRLNGGEFERESCISTEIARDEKCKIAFIAAPPRMSLYMEYSSRIYGIYLRYVAPEDIHVYSVDEVFMDVTTYLRTYRMTAYELAKKMIKDVLKETGITATAGIGTNMYLCKVAMDIVAKHVEADEDGSRIAVLDEMSYREKLWSHTPITDFWRVGAGYARKLKEVGLLTMGDVARCSLGRPGDYYNEELLYRLFGVNAELLIDHAWGYEPCTIKEIKSYVPEANSISNGQVLKEPYDYEHGLLIVKEMTELLTLSLVEKGYVTDQLVLTVGYDIDNLTNASIKNEYKGEIVKDRYGRRIPKHAHGTWNLKEKTSSSRIICDAMAKLYEQIVNPKLLIRRVYVVAGKVTPYSIYIEERDKKEQYVQYDLFTDMDAVCEEELQHREQLDREHKLQEAIIGLKKKYGKNAVLKGMNLEEGATTIERNGQIGGHKA